ncbi:sulfotransferase family 2, cytosolic sulfotransferase 3 [Silurus asotus]|uniref:Sulfotransferase n=1 Tax=Silurus asotus TaxID=30991 RepID=A0AAD5FCS8_SILAS|nr:sulfotransferase family 2, cytosolic sulfotransferase 3 [Silurus asotus]
MDSYLVYRGLLLPKIIHTEDSLKYYESIEFQDDDVIVITYPKSGTTWMQEILPSLLNGGDPTPVLTIPSWIRVPWLEQVCIPEVMHTLSAPRAFVSHMPFNLMPPSFFTSKAKVIYITRNPKDVAVSYFYFNQMASFLPDPGNFEEYANNFLAGKVIYGKWTDHVKSWRNPGLGDRILYITYEEMIQDVYGVIKCVLGFLDRQLSEDALKGVVEQCQFKNMKQNKMSNYSLVPPDYLDARKSSFLRKGIAGDWKNHFSPELDAKFNEVINEELKGTDYRFLWEQVQHN